MSTDNNLLRPPTRTLNPDHLVPLSPPIRPPFSHYNSAVHLPATPHTPFDRRPPPEDPQNMSSPTLPPYLTLSPRILLTSFSPALLPIILTIAHLIQNRSSTASLASSLRSSLLSACSGIAKGAASIQTFPRYLAMQTNDEVVRATQASILAIGMMLIDSVTIIETVVNFIVDTYRSMLLCTLELAIRGTLEILIDAVQTISDSVTSTLNSVRTDIQDDISSANNVIQSAVSAINTVTSLVDVNLSVPNFTIPSLSFSENVTIPTSVESTLITLNSSLPTLNELKEKMDSIIDTPFELLISEINSTRLDMAASFNSSMLPVPSLSSLAADDSNSLSNELCSNLDTSLIDDTASALHKLSTVAIGLMFLLLFLVWAALAVWEWRKWRALKGTVEVVEDDWRREGRADAWRMVTIVEHPMLEKYGPPILRRVAPAPRTRENLRWFLSYLAHPTCLALLFVALLGFLSIQFQLVALNAIKDHASSTANATVTASTNSLVTKLNDAAMNSSQSYADEYNTVVAAYQTRIDDELFGSWLNTTAVTLNTTLVQFYDEIETCEFSFCLHSTLLNATFGGTILYSPINTFIYCILGSKITNLEEGLTWIADHAQITLPTLPSDILLLSNSSMNEIATPIASAAAGSSTNSSDDGFVGTLIDHFESALVVERNFYAILLGVWLGLFLIGLAVVIWHSGGRDRYVAWRGVPPSDSPSAPKGPARWLLWMKDTHPIYDEYAEKEFRGTPVPRIVEPEGKTSFFNYQGEQNRGSVNSNTQGAVRPSVGRSGTFGSTLSSLAAPGQAFLKITGRKLSGSNINNTSDRPRESLLDEGMNSEKYNAQPLHNVRDADSRAEIPPPFWVNKFYGAKEGVRSIFPTRGQRHGAALAAFSGLKRGASTRTEKSFGASRVPTARTPGADWQGGSRSPSVEVEDGAEYRGMEGRDSVPEWGMVDPQSIGRALEQDDGGRYPPLPLPTHVNVNYNGVALRPSQNMREQAYHSHPVYPRPMSRAPTLHEGTAIPRRILPSNPFDDQPPPPPPSKETWHAGQAQALAQARAQAQEASEGERDTYIPRPWETAYDSPEEEECINGNAGEEEALSPTSERTSFASEPQVASASRVNLNTMATVTGSPANIAGNEGRGTAALSEILREMKDRSRVSQDPFKG